MTRNAATGAGVPKRAAALARAVIGIVGATVLFACTSTTGTEGETPAPTAGSDEVIASAPWATTPLIDETPGSAAPPVISPATTLTVATAPPTTQVASTTPYMVPLSNAAAGGWGDTHAGYPATDLFENGCGNGVTSPVNGVLLEVRRINGYDETVDNPATRGGRSISVLGDDGVRYYMAHFELIDDSLAVNGRVTAGQYLGTIGNTGRSSACHLHFGISPPCPSQEWLVRRGVVWPYPYLNDWQAGGQLSPVDEVTAWVEAHPDACAIAAADPFAADS